MTGRGQAPETPPGAAPAGAALPPLLLSVVVVLALAWAHRRHFVDDAFIGLRFIENLRAGHGFVFNPGDPAIEGVTNLGWTMLLLPLAAVMPATLAAKIAGAASLILALVLFARLMPRPSEAGAALAAAPLLLVATCFDVAYFALAGMETGLLFALTMALAALVARRAGPAGLAIVATACFCVRPEALAIPALFAVLRRDRDSVTLLVVALLLAGVVTLVRLWLFGDWLPQPARAKGSSILVVLTNLREIATGSRAHLPFPLVGLPVVGLIVVGWRRLRDDGPAAADMMLAIAGAGALFALYALPDWTELARYAAPYAPAMILLAWTGFVGLIGGRRAIALASLGVLLVVAAIDHVAKTARADRFPGYVLFGERLVAPARWIAANTPRDAVVASRRIGALGLFGERRVFDYAVGLIDRDVARLFAAPERGIDDPNDPRLAAPWRRQRPTHLLEDDDVLDRIARAAGGGRDGFVVHGETYRVVKAFALGAERHWLLAERVDP